MKCKNCASFPCTRKECELYNGQCEYGVSLIEQVSKEMRKERKDKDE